jgi:UDP-2-acetamido-3-amino-2,3-dideoxy-glucuronate N-acetyltransferase
MQHPTAEVSPEAIIGNDVKIWHHTQVREKAVIGNETLLAKNVYIDKDVMIGTRCKIQNNCSIYHGTHIGDGVFIGPHCVLANDLTPRAINTDGSLKDENDWLEGKITIEKGASLGARVVVLPNVRIGKFAMVGAGSVVTRDIPDYGLVYGSPAKLRGFVCSCGRNLAVGKLGGEPCERCSE